MLVVGTIGVMQALQAIKIILQSPGILSGRLLMFDGVDMIFRNLKLRMKNPDCAVCGNNPSIKSLIDYEEFCGAKANDKNPNLKILDTKERISVNEYSDCCKLPYKPYILVDVRSNEEFEMCHLRDAINIPLTTINHINSLNKLKQHIDDAGSELLNGKIKKIGAFIKGKYIIFFFF